ncbi:MAG: DUF5110 domain-containing protein, partial [Candidatus Aminicenantes bacterium]|nr:DUF5110 domain-containing protein [Candidatus Aminicenantes bacterium]
QYADEPVDVPLSLVIYPGADGLSTLYEDDGKTFAYREGKRMWIEMGWHNAERRLTLRMARGSHLLPPVPRTFEVRVAGEKTKKTVVFDGSVSDINV